MRSKTLKVVLVTVAVLLGGCTSVSGSALVIEEQGSFFVGGKDVKSDSLAAGTAFPPSGTITTHQMYVRYQKPPRAKLPVVLIHGCCLTGKTWESTPDGRAGWDELFVRAGYPTYVVDQVARGRSAANTSNVIAAKTGAQPVSAIDAVFFASHEAAWEIFRFGPKYPQRHPDSQFPLDHVGEFWKQMVPDWNFSLGSVDVQMGTANPTIGNLASLTRLIGPSVLVGHSQSGIYPFNVARVHKQGVAAIVALEPAFCPAPGDSMDAFRNIPILMVWGEHNDKSAFWAPRLRACNEFADAARRAGVPIQVVMLSEVGFAGASHMLMQDRNSDSIAQWLVSWLSKAVK